MGFPVFFGTNPHLTPVGKPAPPRPRRPDFFTISMMSLGLQSLRDLRSPWYPPRDSYTPISRRFGTCIFFVRIFIDRGLGRKIYWDRHCGLRIVDCGFQSEIDNPQSAISIFPANDKTPSKYRLILP